MKIRKIVSLGAFSGFLLFRARKRLCEKAIVVYGNLKVV